jgi:hypothetical protein
MWVDMLELGYIGAAAGACVRKLLDEIKTLKKDNRMLKEYIAHLEKSCAIKNTRLEASDAEK